MNKIKLHELETQRANLIFALTSPHMSQEQKAKIERMLNDVEGELALYGAPPRTLVRESGKLSPKGEQINLRNEESR